MSGMRRIGLYLAAALLVALSASAGQAACTATFTAGDEGTFGGTFKYDGKTQVLTVDLSGLGKNAEIFRAELVLRDRPQFHNVPLQPTTVYPVGQPEKKLQFVPPRFVSLDALEAVRAAVQAGKPLELKLEVTLAGPARLEVSYAGGKAKNGSIPAATGLKVLHRSGQSLIVFTEPSLDCSLPVAAPFEGKLQSLAVEAGQKVKQGLLLASLDTSELRAQLEQAKAEQAEALKLAEQYSSEKKNAEARTAQDRARKAQARAQQLEDQIGRADLLAPIDGVVVIEGEHPQVGSAVKAGQRLLQIKGKLAGGSYPPLERGADVANLQQQVHKANPALSFRIWRGPEKITAQSIAKARLVGECGVLTGWNSGYHQGDTPRQPPIRYRVTDGGQEVPWGTGIYAYNTDQAGKAYYAVTVAVNGEEDLDHFTDGNATPQPVEETIGQGEPILQWVEQPEAWHYRRGPLTRLIYTRWEAWPNSSTPSKPIDYLVAMGDQPRPEKPPREAEQHAWRVEPAPVGLHLHCWGASLNGGYGWWHNANRGAVLIASNQIPYDWWTGYHEANGTCKTYGDGHVQPFTMNRTFSFLKWATTQWKDGPESIRAHWRKLDLARVFTAGSSMGGSGAPMFAVRYGQGKPTAEVGAQPVWSCPIAWCMAWVGVHVPEESPGFSGSYRGSYGPRDPLITMPDGQTSPWDYFSDVWWMRKYPKLETGFIMAGNGKDDGGIGWPQAYKFARALQETRRPHLFNWGLGGHGVRTLIGANFDLDVRSDQTLPAFTNCSLDEDIGTGRMKTKEEIQEEIQALQAKAAEAGQDPKKVHVSPADGAASGAYNAHLWWQTDDVIDQPGTWEMTVILKPSAPKDACTVDLTPRRCQKFAAPAGAKFRYSVTDLQANKVLASGQATADDLDLLTLKQIPLVKGNNRVKIEAEK